MLQKLEFSLRDHEDKCTSKIDSDGVFAVLINPESEFWKKHKMTEPDILFAVKEHEPGVYETGGYNFDHDMDFYADYKEAGHGNLLKDGSFSSYDDSDKEIKKGNFIDYFESTISAYGVADNVEQIKERFKEAIDHSTNKIVISFTTLNKSEQPEEYGWRWHKWGTYIGTQDPQCEYLADEPVIEQVIVYHVYPVVEK